MANVCQRKLAPGHDCTALISLRFHDPPSHVSARCTSFLLLICGGNQQLSSSPVYLSFWPAASRVQSTLLTIETVTPVDETKIQYRRGNDKRKPCLFAPFSLYWSWKLGNISATLSPPDIEQEELLRMTATDKPHEEPSEANTWADMREADMKCKVAAWLLTARSRSDIA